MSYLRSVPSGLGEAGREEAIRRTAEHLSIEPQLRVAFEVMARQSALEMEQAMAVRGVEVSALGVVSPSVRNELVVSTQRYAAARQGALDRIEPYLGQTPACQDFRQEFDSWAGLVAAKAQGGR